MAINGGQWIDPTVGLQRAIQVLQAQGISPTTRDILAIRQRLQLSLRRDGMSDANALNEWMVSMGYRPPMGGPPRPSPVIGYRPPTTPGNEAWSPAPRPTPPGSPGTNQIRTGDPVVGRQPPAWPDNVRTGAYWKGPGPPPPNFHGTVGPPSSWKDGTYGHDNVVGRTPPRTTVGIPETPGSQIPPLGLGNSLPAQKSSPQGWDDYMKQNYKPGVNIMQLRNQYASQGGGFRNGGTARYDAGGTVLSAGQRLQNIKMGLRPSTYYNMLPSARQFTEGAVSALGMPPEDFWFDLERGFPTGPNPNQGITAGFQDGGKISIKHGPDGSFEYKRG